MEPHVANRVTVIGGTGFLGGEISRVFPEAQAPSRQEFDLTNRDAILPDAAADPDLLIVASGLKVDQLTARTTPADWSRQLETNLLGVGRLVGQISKGMCRRGRGHIVLLSSYAAEHPVSGQAAYSCAKAALEALTKQWAKEFGPSGVRVNAIRPGFMKSPMTAGLNEKRLEDVRRDHVLPTINDAASVVQFIHFLHHQLPHTSGQCFNLDSRIV